MCDLDIGNEEATAILIAEYLRKLSKQNRSTQAYIFVTDVREVYAMAMDNNNVDFFLAQHPDWLLGVYTHRVLPSDLLDDLKSV